VRTREMRILHFSRLRSIRIRYQKFRGSIDQSAPPPRLSVIRRGTREGSSPRALHRDTRCPPGRDNAPRVQRTQRRIRGNMSKAAFAGLKAVQEIRFHLCQTSKGSEGVRNFLLKSYKKMKAASPATPILIREASGVQGGMVARYGTSRTPDSTSKRTRRTRGVRARSRASRPRRDTPSTALPARSSRTSRALLAGEEPR
jgi:hypothetical protein